MTRVGRTKQWLWQSQLRELFPLSSRSETAILLAFVTSEQATALPIVTTKSRRFMGVFATEEVGGPSAIWGICRRPWFLAIRPSFDLVDLKHAGDRPQLCLLVRSLRAAGKGIVCKLRDAPYRSGARSTWTKVKSDEWKAANRSQALSKER